MFPASCDAVIPLTFTTMIQYTPLTSDIFLNGSRTLKYTCTGTTCTTSTVVQAYNEIFFVSSYVYSVLARLAIRATTSVQVVLSSVHCSGLSLRQYKCSTSPGIIEVSMAFVRL